MAEMLFQPPLSWSERTIWLPDLLQVVPPPRTFIAKIMNYRDRNAIFRLPREKGSIPLHNGMVVVYPDFSAEVQHRRSQFTEVKRQLRAKNLKYTMLYPARLGDDRVHFFEDPELSLPGQSGATTPTDVHPDHFA